MVGVLAQPAEDYDPYPPDNRTSIVCDGPLPFWPLPVFPEWNPNGATLQEICAKSHDGGHELGPDGPRTVGLWCAGYDNRLDMADVLVRESDPRALVTPSSNGNLAIARLTLYCIQRCFCRWRWDGGSTVRKPIHISEMNTIGRSAPYYSTILRVDRYSDFTNPGKYNVQQLIARESMWIQDAPQGKVIAGLENFDPHARRSGGEAVMLDRQNRIECSGNVPFNIYIPPPLNRLRYKKNRLLCAMALSGGDPAGNAGGYCYNAPRPWAKRLGPIWDQPSDIWFADEFTPRLEWTWSHNFRFATYIRAYCRERCWCEVAGSKPKTRFRESFWRLTSETVAVESPEGWMHVANADGFISMDYLNIPNHPKRPYFNDGDFRRQEPWPTSSLGPSPSTPPWAQTIRGNLPRCGSTCTKAEDCGGGSCKCIMPPASILTQPGVNIGSGAALCLVEAAMIQLLKTGGTSNVARGGTRGKRAVEEEQWGCVCNQTYVSRACCNSQTGILWEDSSMKLGELKSSNEM
ncbi:MAG: hypothetical protein M1814_004995 [Vezdaea aestivalis]|nr:MAG: hypothetical protein M1814_004995 [Vezdaea aestivalis]